MPHYRMTTCASQHTIPTFSSTERMNSASEGVKHPKSVKKRIPKPNTAMDRVFKVIDNSGE